MAEEKPKKRTILWHSNASHSPTGYGNQTQMFTPRIAAAGYDIVISAFYGREGAPAINADGILELPRFRHPYGNDVIETHMKYVGAQAVISLIDPFALDAKTWGKLPWATIVPVDCAPVSPENVAVIKHARWVWAMSKFGMEQLTAAGLNPVYVPHGIDTEVFKPVDRDECRAKIGKFVDRDLTGKFLVATAAANKGAPSRKNFAGMLEAFAIFAQAHEDAVFYLHTDAEGFWGGDDIHVMAEALGIRDRLIFPPPYHLMCGMLPPAYMNDVYNAADVFMLLSYGEGFGLPIVEAQAAGCPVIVTDGSTGPELCFSGWKVPALPVQALQGRYGTRWWMALPPEGAKALETAYEKRGDQGVRERARAGALDYDVETVFKKYMQPAIEKIFEELESEAASQEPVVIPARTEAAPPKVSVIMPVFNGKGTIDRAIESVLAQGVDCELIICDDDSDDGTWKYLRKFRDRKGIRIINNRPGGGPVGAINAAVAQARGEYIIKLDADDWLVAGALGKLATALDDNPGVGFVYGACQYHGKMETLYRPPAFEPTDFWGRNAAVGEVMYRREAHEKGLVNRGFWSRDGREFGPHDWDFVLQMIHTLGWTGLALPNVVVLHYWHHTNSASDETKKQNGAVIAKFKETWPQVTAEAT